MGANTRLRKLNRILNLGVNQIKYSKKAAFMRHICSSKLLSFKIQMCSLKNSSHLARTTFKCKKNGAKKEDTNNKYLEVCISNFLLLFNTRLCKCSVYWLWFKILWNIITYAQLNFLLQPCLSVYFILLHKKVYGCYGIQKRFNMTFTCSLLIGLRY